MSKPLADARVNKSAQKVSNIEFLNAIRENSDSWYQERIPEATRENIAELSQAIQGNEYKPVYNQIVNDMIGLIAFQWITRRDVWLNPLSNLKKGMVPYGQDIEEIFVDMAKAHVFDAELAETEVFKREYPDIKAVYHRRNRQDEYKCTLSKQQMMMAFTQEYGLNDLMTQVALSLTRGDNQDEFLLTKQMLAQSLIDNTIHVEVVDSGTDSETMAKNLVKKLRSLSSKFTFNSKNYNEAGVTTYTRRENQTIFINPDMEAEIDVEVLARAFNMDKTDFLSKVIIVDDFGSATNLENVLAFLVDDEWFCIWDNLYETGAIQNPSGLYINNFLHHWQTYGVSPFCNATAIMKKPESISVSVSPETATVKKGSTYQFTGTVTGDSLNLIEWSIDSTLSTINELGLLDVNENETATQIIVTATSKLDSSKKATATVTVTTN